MVQPNIGGGEAATKSFKPANSEPLRLRAVPPPTGCGDPVWQGTRSRRASRLLNEVRKKLPRLRRKQKRKSFVGSASRSRPRLEARRKAGDTPRKAAAAVKEGSGSSKVQTLPDSPPIASSENRISILLCAREHREARFPK